MAEKTCSKKFETNCKQVLLFFTQFKLFPKILFLTNSQLKFKAKKRGHPGTLVNKALPEPQCMVQNSVGLKYFL